MLAVGDQGIGTLRVGDHVPTRAYQGDELVWELAPVTMTIDGTAFSPQLELAAESVATITWVDETDLVVGTGVEPTITWGDAGPHTVRMLVSSPEDVVTFNIGFHEAQDNGIYSLPASYRHVTQPVTGINNLQNLKGLRRFMAARTDGIDQEPANYTGPLLGGSLNFTGMNTLEYIECFGSEVSSVLLGGTAVIRLCLEACNLTSIDVNPVRMTLLDFRVANQQGGELTIAPLDGPLEVLYHFCARRQQLYGMPDMTDMPAIRQLWIWRCGVTVDTMTVRSTDVLHSIVLSSGDNEGPNNSIRVLDLEDTTWGGLEGLIRVRADAVGLEEVRLTGMMPVQEVRLFGNNLNSAALDEVATVVDGWGTSGGLLRIHNNAGQVGASGYTAVQNLLGRGWTVDYTAPSAPAISTTSLPVLSEGTAISAPLLASGANDIAWAVTAGTLPAGLSLSSSTGVISGTPTTAGAYDFTVTATNFMGSDAQQYTGSVLEPSGTLLWEDTFERTNASGWANSGGWFPGPGEVDTDVAIVDGALVLSGTDAYRRFLHDDGGSLPADLEVEVGFTIASASEPGDGTYWGICDRVNTANNTGCRIIFRNDKNTIRIGNIADASDPGTNISVAANLPATWNNPGQHTLTLRSVGNLHTILADGVEIASRSFSTNSTFAGGAVGFVGEPQGRAWDYIRVYAAA